MPLDSTSHQFPAGDDKVLHKPETEHALNMTKKVAAGARSPEDFRQLMDALNLPAQPFQLKALRKVARDICPSPWQANCAISRPPCSQVCSRGLPALSYLDEASV